MYTIKINIYSTTHSVSLSGTFNAYVCNPSSTTEARDNAGMDPICFIFFLGRDYSMEADLLQKLNLLPRYM